MKKSILSSLIMLVSLFTTNTVFSIPAFTKVPSTIAWTNTGYSVNLGDKIEIEANGEIYTNEAIKCNPNGVADHPELQENFCILKTLNHACLIGKIGVNGIPFFVGANLSMTANAGGELYLGINDTDFKNNKGEYLAVITIVPYQNYSNDTLIKRP